MTIIEKNDNIVVIDGALTASQFGHLLKAVKSLNFCRMGSAGLNDVWALTDPPPFASEAFSYSDHPNRAALTEVVSRLVDVAEHFPQLLGRKGHAWTDVAFRVFMYPRGSRVVWHTDSIGFTGALVFYAHEHWSSAWGGELLVADRSKPKYRRRSAHVANNEAVMDAPGTYVFPKPNRLVLLKSGVYHMLATVDPDAGANVRCSINGFFTSRK